MIGILNLNLGNLRSVSNAVYELGYDFLIIDQVHKLDDISHLIIPGVGYFATAMRCFLSLGFFEAVKKHVISGKPLLGICLGMHLLASSSEEGSSKTEGLCLIPGSVLRFRNINKLRVPHVGWNTVTFQKQHPIFDGVRNNCDFYFVHSYHYFCDDTDNIYGTTEYGDIFPSVICKNNVIGFQFHPEKSQKNGLRLLENFCQWSGKC